MYIEYYIYIVIYGDTSISLPKLLIFFYKKESLKALAQPRTQIISDLRSPISSINPINPIHSKSN